MIDGDSGNPGRAHPAAEGAETGEDAGQAEDLVRAIVRMSPLPMVLTDPHRADFPVIFCNAAFCRLTGYPAAEVLGRNCRFLQGPASSAVAIRALGDAIRAGSEAQVDLWNYRKDGSRFWNSMFVGPVHDADGRLVYYFGSQVDSSARRAMEEAANRERRMDTLGAMAAGVAHEINNLMTVIAGNAENLGNALEKGLADGRQKLRVERIAWAAGSAGKLTRQMLAFAGRQGLQAETVDLNGVLQQMDRLLGDVPPGRRPVDVVLHPETLLARVDAGQLELALINLVRNAADASPPGARIVVTAAAAAGRQDDPLGLAEISVADCGSGMTPETAARAVEPFFTTKEHGKGTGLGLSMVAGFCRESGGRMSIESDAGRGTVVRLVFPRLES